MAYELPKLPYPYDALEPYVDARTMEIHHTKHHKTYVDKVNAALEGHPEFQKMSVDELLENMGDVPEKIRNAVVNNGGGHANHSMFWTLMGPNKGGQPKGGVGDAIASAFGDFKTFQDAFKKEALDRFGSGWAWLVLRDGKLLVMSTPNQNNPRLEGDVPLLGIDVWEHAYYLKYQNRRPDYVDAWWNTVDWDAVEKHFQKAK